MKFQKIKNISFSIPKEPNEKNWVIVTFENDTQWMPALVDLADILSKIGKCEDIKYPHGEGFEYTMRFIERCFDKTRKEIEAIYKEEFNISDA